MRLNQTNDQPPKSLEENLSSVLSNDVSKKSLAEAAVLRKLAGCWLQIKTRLANNDEEYQHAYPVIRRMLPANWYLPGGRFIFETACTDQRAYRYHPHQFVPTQAIMRLDDH